MSPSLAPRSPVVQAADPRVVGLGDGEGRDVRGVLVASFLALDLDWVGAGLVVQISILLPDGLLSSVTMISAPVLANAADANFPPWTVIVAILRPDATFHWASVPLP